MLTPASPLSEPGIAVDGPKEKVRGGSKENAVDDGSPEKQVHERQTLYDTVLMVRLVELTHAGNAST